MNHQKITDTLISDLSHNIRKPHQDLMDPQKTKRATKNQVCPSNIRKSSSRFRVHSPFPNSAAPFVLLANDIPIATSSLCHWPGSDLIGGIPVPQREEAQQMQSMAVFSNYWYYHLDIISVTSLLSNTPREWSLPCNQKASWFHRHFVCCGYCWSLTGKRNSMR